ncbi:MAG: DUF4844 domain-containing protein [Hydrococcus sp. RU_2_2]|nr:DUF4844 domain-containing protein [Hydrococcus sp. RU_2_2]
MEQFEQFKAKEEFGNDTLYYYPGISDPSLKPILTQKINLAADDFQKLAEKGTAGDAEFQEAIKAGLERFGDTYVMLDTEDRERVCHYFEELMDIDGLESSGGHLNNFMYDFDPNVHNK